MPLAELWKLHEQVIVQLRIKLAAETCVAPTRRYFPNIKIREIPLRLGQVAGGGHVGSVHSLDPEKNSTISEFIIHPITVVGHTHKRTQRFSQRWFLLTELVESMQSRQRNAPSFTVEGYFPSIYWPRSLG